MKIYQFEWKMVKFFVISSTLEKAVFTFVERLYLFNPHSFTEIISFCFDEKKGLSIVLYRGSYVLEKDYSISTIEIEEGTLFS